MNASGFEHDELHVNVHGAALALEAKVGTGASTPVADAVLMGTGTGTSGWDTSPTFKGTVTLGVNDTGVDLVCYGAADGAYMKWNQATDDLQLVGAAGLDIAGDIDVDGTANLDAVDIDGAVQIDNTVTVGIDGTGHDVLFYGCTGTNGYMLWDEDTDDLILGTASKLGLGATSPSYPLHISTTDNRPIGIVSSASGSYLDMRDTATTGEGYVSVGAVGDAMKLIAGGSIRATLTSTGLGIGTIAPSDKLHVADATTTVSGTQIWAEGRYGGYGAGVSFASATSDGGTLKEMAKISGDGDAAWTTDAATQDASLRFFTCLDGTLAEKMRIKGDGNVGIGTDAPVGALDVNGAIHFENGTNRYISYRAANADILFSFDSGDFYLQDLTNSTHWFYTGNSARLTISDSVVNCVGEFTAGTKTFDIAHPTRGGDWRLRHASIEGPRHDLIYRGTVTLSGGTATVDLDEASNMTDGTWEALCRDPWTMVASSGNAVEWVLDGKTLTVTSDTADAVCSWIVMAERHDPQVYSEAAPSADNDGHFITEFEREASPPPAPPEEAEEAAT
tara:strand:+ start:3864 stop:5549 length:1686 start_codon:yes stop_codon:yes gene_type:complete